ncbi:MAG: AI-2E family transporter [Coprobacillus sp.]
MKKKIVFIIFIIIYCYIIKNMFHVFFPFICAFLCFFMIKPLIDYLDKRFSLKRSAIGVSLLLIIYIVVALILGIGLSYFIIWLLQFIRLLPLYYEEYIIPISNQILQIISQKFSFLMNMDILNTFESNLHQIFGCLIEQITLIISSIPKYIFAFFIFLISTFYLVLEYDEMKEKCLRFCSWEFVRSFIDIKNNGLRSIKIYLKCQLTLMLLCFVLLWIGFSILKFPHPFLYALLTSVLDSLPFIGVGIVLIPMIIFFFIQNHYLMAIYIFLLYLIINLLRSVLEPHIMNKQTKIPSFIFLSSMVIHMYLFGFVGVFLSPIHVNLLCGFFESFLVNKK